MVAMTHVDAFTSELFGGNPAAVCVLDQPHSERWMQLVAREMNVSETAFVVRGSDAYGLRWFTPTVEVDLCGHATLASAHVLWSTGEHPPDRPARFDTRSGILTATRRGDWIELDFPVTPEQTTEPPAGLLDALGLSSGYVGKSRFDYLVEVADEAIVRGLRPDFSRLCAIEARGAIVTSRAADSDVDFVSRYFAPAYGVDEDPATGSTHCCLAEFWSRKLGKSAFRALQLSERGGEMQATLDGDRVRLLGQAVTVFRGELCGSATM
ncbi:MAG TPA: PhzF family phenazine biosynthesis protein [Vicinamibacterales bacterium]